jgi:hypothetical protein
MVVLLAGSAGALAQGLPNENLPGNSPSLPNSNLPGTMPDNNPITLPSTDTTPSVIVPGQEFYRDTNLPIRNPSVPPTPEQLEAMRTPEDRLNEQLQRSEQAVQDAKDEATKARDEAAAARDEASKARDEAADLRQQLEEAQNPTDNAGGGANPSATGAAATGGDQTTLNQ